MPVAGQVVDYSDDATFLQALARLPCCVTNKDGDKNGDPLNLVVVGGFDDVLPAFVRRGWRPTEEKWAGSVMKMITSAISGEPYAYAPISDLYFSGRAQDNRDSNQLAALEGEFVITASPTEIAACSTSVSAKVAQIILERMGIEFPLNIYNLPGSIVTRCCCPLRWAKTWRTRRH